jgi:bifunctional enzyme CysN/CysC
MNKHSTLSIVTIGHVDHGKSTLIGRLLHDTNALPDGKVAELTAACTRRGVPFEWSFVLDAFQAERDQAVTIDTTRLYFSSAHRPYVLIDAPGHREFLKNMMSGAAAADAAVLVIDAAEGMQEQTRRHAFLLSLLGIHQVVVAVNKMDRVGFDAAVFAQRAAEATSYLSSLRIVPAACVPVCASGGDMLSARGDHMPWYTGPTLLAALDALSPPASDDTAPMRFPVQDVYRIGDTRVLVGRVETGAISVGDVLTFSPTNEQSEVVAIRVWPDSDTPATVHAGDAAGIVLKDRIFVERGHIGAHERSLPVMTGTVPIHLFWLSSRPLAVGQTYTLRLSTAAHVVTVAAIGSVMETDTLSPVPDAARVEKNMSARVTFRARGLIPADDYADNRRTGRAVIEDGDAIAGGGLITLTGVADQRASRQPKSQNIFAVTHAVTPEMRAQKNHHTGGVFWLTGLSGAGKSTLAMAVERALFDRGISTYVLDGDNVRRGLNADLGFSAADRTENIRRVGEVAALMADAGLVVLSAFISPFTADRDRARQAAGEKFHEIYVKADVATCETRDPKGLYKKARAGAIKDFTGIDSPYEPPALPELIVDTQRHDEAACAEMIISYIEGHVRTDSGAFPPREKDFS